MERLRIGNSLDKGIDIGAIVAPVQLKTIDELVQQGVNEGCTMWQPSWACPEDGYFYPPTLFTDVSPSSSIAQVEIFGPVLAAMSFRSHKEAVKLANNTIYGLAASIWTENINLALDIAPQIKAGTVWINCTNFFDAASGFGGYRESGFGREGGKEGLFEYVKPRIEEKFSEKPFAPQRKKPKAPKDDGGNHTPGIDRTAKMYIGGKTGASGWWIQHGHQRSLRQLYRGSVAGGTVKISGMLLKQHVSITAGQAEPVMPEHRYSTTWPRTWPFAGKNLPNG